MFKRILSTIICTIFFLSFSLSVYGDPVTTTPEINSVSSDQERLEDLEQNVSKLDNEILEYMEQMEQLEAEIKVYEEKIAQKEIELKKAQDNIQYSKNLFSKRMRYLYESDYERGYIYLLFDSESFGDFISRLTTLKTLIEYDKRVIAQLKQRETELELQRQLFLGENQTLQNSKTALDEKLSAVNQLKDGQTLLINELKAKTKTLGGFTSFELPSRGAVGAFGYEVVSYSRNFLGIPYVWGGNTPEKGFDCSGYTQYVFKHFGIFLNRTSSAQALQGTPVAYKDLEPGDLVFYGSPVYHVGIYVGGNQFIHAPHRGEVVKVAPIIMRYYSGARRIQP